MIALVLTIFLVAVAWAVVVFLGLPPAIAAVITAALALTWGAVLAWRWWKARRAAREIERTLKAQAEAQARSARPDQQGEVEAMQAEFAKAIQALKSSKLARGGRDALAVLPWYLIIGPSGAGKTTALRASGLKFPYLTKRGGVRGIGGTRNCDWWLTNEAVLLDTAGRYATEEEDHEEWTAFLDSLARTRKRRPVNGLLVAVPITDVGAGTEEAAADLGRLMRERVDEVMSRLRVVLPVYVVLTKCDLLPGFVETFADLRKADRGQLWGFTLELQEQGDRIAVAEERFDELVAVAEERAQRRLADARQLGARERAYEFPQQLAAVREHLRSFLDGLFTENVYQDSPILRGVYLTSGTQEGRVIDRVLSAVAEAFGVRPEVPQAEPVLEAKSYFLRDVFASVVFPDQHIAAWSPAAQRRALIRQWAAVAGAALLLVFLLALPLRSFLAGRALLVDTAEMAERIAARLAPEAAQPATLEDLEPLRQRLEELSGEPSWVRRFGFGRGEELLPPLERLYAVGARRLVAEPAWRGDLQALEALARRFEAPSTRPGDAEYARAFAQLKLHLLVTAPRGRDEPAIGPAEQAWIAGQLVAAWVARQGSTPSTPARDRAAAHAHAYARLLAREPGLALARYDDVVLRVRRVLARTPIEDLAIQRLAAEMDPKYDLTLSGMLGGPVTALRGATGVPGAFTRRAYEDLVKARLDDPGALAELWVVADPGSPDHGAAAEVERIRSRYFERYVEAWQRFIEGVSLDRQSAQPLALLQELTAGESPPFARLFRELARNTRIGGLAGAAARAGEGFADRVRRSLGGPEAAPARPARLGGGGGPLGPRDVEDQLAGFVDFGALPEAPLVPLPGGGASPPRTTALDQYQEQLAFIRDALRATGEGGDPAALLGRVQEARTKVEALERRQPARWQAALHALLWPPIELATSKGVEESTRDAALKWCSTVAMPFRRNLATRYPFVRSPVDAPLADVAEFFRPGAGVLWAFYGEALRAGVQRTGDGFQFARQLGGGGFRPELLPFLTHADELTTALFPGNAPEPQVPLTVHVRPTPGVAAVFLEVDGQRVEYRNGPDEWTRLTWPGPARGGGAILRIRAVDGREDVLAGEGEWGLFRLLELGMLRGDGGPLDFAIAFAAPAVGATVVIDFRQARSESPFLGRRRGTGPRLLGPFRGLGPIPLEIGRGGPSCE